MLKKTLQIPNFFFFFINFSEFILDPDAIHLIWIHFGFIIHVDLHRLTMNFDVNFNVI